MNSIVFDTHAAASRYKRAGFTEDQIEALVEIARETTALPDISTLATKADLAQLEAKMDARFQQSEAKMDARFQQSEAKTETGDARLEARIADAQVQAVTIILSGTAIIVTLATVLSKLVH